MALGVGLGALENHIGDTAQQRKVPTDDAAFLTPPASQPNMALASRGMSRISTTSPGLLRLGSGWLMP